MSRVAIVSHDAGGAEILSSWALSSGDQCDAVVAGPAQAIFDRKCPDLPRRTLDEAVAACDWLLCGTGWQSSFERDAITRGRELGKKTVAFLDHWTNYRERFEVAAGQILPDEIWVGDEHALRIARETFPDTPVVMEPNPYFEELRQAFLGEQNKIPNRDGLSILYVCEPIREHALSAYGDERYWGYTEEEAMIYFLENNAALRSPMAHIVIRPHPAEPKEKYSWASEYTSVKIEFGGKKDLLAEINAADVVVGCGSAAMVVGLIAGKRVISTIPPGGQECQLPHPEIEHLQDLIKTDAGYA